MANATKIIKDWCASCGMPEPSDGECHALTVALAATPAADAVESVLIDGTAYEVPAPVACELLYLHMATQAAAAPVVLPEPDAYLFQHEETGLTVFVDAEQVDDWGFEARNPRLQKISGIYTEQQVRALLATGGQGQAYKDSTPQLHVGDSSFEGWYAGYVKEGTVSLKQNCRDAYAAGMGDPLVVSAPQPQADARDAVEKLPRYTYGYKSDEWGMSSHLRSYQDPDGKFLNREEVIAAIAAAKGEYERHRAIQK